MYNCTKTCLIEFYALRVNGLQDNINLNLLKLTDAHSVPSLHVVVTFKSWTNMSILISSNELFGNINCLFAGKVEVDLIYNINTLMANIHKNINWYTYTCYY